MPGIESASRPGALRKPRAGPVIIEIDGHVAIVDPSLALTLIPLLTAERRDSCASGVRVIAQSTHRQLRGLDEGQ
jgi:hypothetical protein